MRNVILAFVTITGTLIFAFTNCSEVGFEEVQKDLEEVKEAGSVIPDPDPVDEELLSEEEIAELLENTPEEHLDNPVPVSELERDPTLYDIYECRDGGVAICHLPESLKGDSKCLPLPAVGTHFDHVRTYTVEDEVYEMSDYLGACRH